MLFYVYSRISLSMVTTSLDTKLKNKVNMTPEERRYLRSAYHHLEGEFSRRLYSVSDVRDMHKNAKNAP